VRSSGDPSASSRRQNTQAHLCLNLLPENVLESLGVSSKLADTLAEFVNGHGDLVEVETEKRLVVEVALLLDIERRDLGGIELLWNAVLAVVEVLEEVWLIIMLSGNQFTEIVQNLLQWSSNRNQPTR